MKKIDFKEGLDIEFEIVRLSNIFKKFKAGMTTRHRLNLCKVLSFTEVNPDHLVISDRFRLNRRQFSL